MSIGDGSQVRTLPDARWDCRACGHCCRAFELGPIEPDSLAALEAADPASFWPPAARRPWRELRGIPGHGEQAFLARVEGACIFLGEDGHCAIHAQLGEVAKPAFCREFPLLLVQERAGFSAVIRPTCAGLHASRIDGEPIGQRAQALPALPRIYPIPRFEPERVEILPGLGLDLDGWERSEPAVLALLDAPHEPPRQTVAQLRDALARAVGRSLPPADEHRYRRAVHTTLELLGSALQPLDQPDSTDPRARLPGQATGWLRAALAQEPGPLSPTARAWLNQILRSEVLGKGFHRRGGLPRALGLLLAEVHMARAALARDDGAALDAAALSGVLTPWWNLAAHGAVVQALRLAAPTLQEIFLNA